MSGPDHLYIFNLTIGAVGLLWLISRTWHRRNEVPEEVQMLFVVTIGLLSALLAVSTALIVQENRPISADVFAITAVKLLLLAYLWRTRTSLYRTGTRSGPWDERDPDRNVLA